MFILTYILSPENISQDKHHATYAVKCVAELQALFKEGVGVMVATITLEGTLGKREKGSATKSSNEPTHSPSFAHNTLPLGLHPALW